MEQRMASDRADGEAVCLQSNVAELCLQHRLKIITKSIVLRRSGTATAGGAGKVTTSGAFGGATAADTDDDDEDEEDEDAAAVASIIITSQTTSHMSDNTSKLLQLHDTRIQLADVRVSGRQILLHLLHLVSMHPLVNFMLFVLSTPLFLGLGTFLSSCAQHDML